MNRPPVKFGREFEGILVELIIETSTMLFMKRKAPKAEGVQYKHEPGSTHHKFLIKSIA